MRDGPPNKHTQWLKEVSYVLYKPAGRPANKRSIEDNQQHRQQQEEAKRLKC